MGLTEIKVFNQKKATVFMDERAELQEDKEQAIIAIAHEIRNPLQAIKLSNQMMREVFDQQELDQLTMQSYMTIISQNVARIEKYLKDVLTYKERKTSFEPVNICDCIDKAVCEAQDRLYLSGIELNKNYRGSHWVEGNAEKLKTAFLNLIVNSIEAIKDGRGKIWISAYETNNTLRITFKDNGGGMETYISNHLFDPNENKVDGHGIGLHTVKEIITIHKAHIVADSLPGVGTSISILFSSVPKQETAASSKR